MTSTMEKMLKPDEIITVEATVDNTVKKSPDTKYCFTWTSFKNHVMDEVGELLREEKFVDVTIMCDHHVFRAHRVILCSASPLLKQLLELNPCQEPCISLSDVPWTHITWVLQYIYSGQVAVPEERFNEFLATARLLQITTLCNSQDSDDIPKIIKQATTEPTEEPSPKKTRTSRRTARRKAQAAMPVEGTELPIVISTRDLDEDGGDGSTGQQGEVFYRTQAVMQELLKDGSPPVEPGQEIITIQTNAVDDMQVEEVIEVVTSMTGETTATIETSEITCELTDVQNTDMPVMKFLYNPRKANIRPTHSLAPKTCSMCGKVYSNNSNLRQHINLVHMSHSSMKCPLCNKDFKSELYMRRHLICSHNVTPIRKEPHTKESRKTMKITGKTIGGKPESSQQEVWADWSENEAAVESLSQTSDPLGE